MNRTACEPDGLGLGCHRSLRSDHRFREPPISTRVRTFGRVGLLLTGVSIMSGCGGTATSPPQPEQQVSQNPGAAAPPPAEVSGTKSKPEHARDEVWVDDQGRKWLGNVPFDVFFDEPYSVASNQSPAGGDTGSSGTSGTSIAAADSSTPNGTSGTADPDTTSTAAPADGGKSPDTEPPGEIASGGWAEVISIQALDEEVKSIRNFLNENLQSVGAYNSAMLMLPQKAAVLAALAEVASQHPDAVSWKSDAAYIRDLGKQMNASQLQRGAKDQKRMLELFEAASDTLNRSRPAGLTEPPTGDSFGEAAEMRLVMMRMDEAEKRMRTEAGTEAALTSRKDMVAHEATLMATLAKVVTDKSYGFADDAEFTGYGNDVVKAALAIRTASETGDFATYEASLSKIATTCQNCHSKYKND